MAKTLVELHARVPEFVSSDAPVEERMHWVQVPYSDIRSLYEAATLRVQRNHLRRVKKARYLRQPLAVHANFVAVRQADGTLTLADGYTRAAAIDLHLREAPEKVWLGIVDVDSVREAEQVYLAIDSRLAVKTGRDTFEEGLRKANLLGKLQSPVFLTASAVSALATAAAERDPLVAVPRFKRAIERLDALKLAKGPGGLPAGALAACLLLAQHEEDTNAVLQFTLALARPQALGPAERKLVPGALKLTPWLDERRTAGALSGKNVPVIMAQTLGSFVWQQEGASGRLSPVARDEYLSRVKA